MVWLAVTGWQWLFLVEGAPAVLMGLAVPFLLTDWPVQARWLTVAEREWLVETLAEDRQPAKLAGGETLRQALGRPTVWLLALGIFATNTGGYALVFWLPTVVKSAPEGCPRHAADPSDKAVLGWTGLVYFCGLAGVWLSGQSSDRTGERKMAYAAGMALTGVFMTGRASYRDNRGALVFVWLCLAGFFAYSWPSPFWVLPTLTLSDSGGGRGDWPHQHGAANFAGLIGSPIVGTMKGYGASDSMCLLFLAGCYLAGSAVIALLRIPRSPDQNSNYAIFTPLTNPRSSATTIRTRNSGEPSVTWRPIFTSFLTKNPPTPLPFPANGADPPLRGALGAVASTRPDPRRLSHLCRPGSHRCRRLRSSAADGCCLQHPSGTRPRLGQS